MSERPKPLIATADGDLLDDLLRLAAAADAEVDVAQDPEGVRRRWRQAPLVLLGADLADAVAAAAPGLRHDVVLVGRDADADIWRRAVAVGAQEVGIVPDAEATLVDRLAEAAEPATGTALTVCVAGGRGGAGASVLAAALAITGMRRRRRVLLVDGDPLGGGIDLVLGQERSAGARWPDFAARRGRVSCAALRSALPAVDRLTVLSRQRGDTDPIPGPAMRAVLTAARRGSDLVVVDLPRYLDPAAAEALAQADLALLVVPAEVRAVAAAAGVSVSLLRHVAEVRVVVRRGPSRLRAEVVAQSLGLPLAGEMAAEPGLTAALDRGEPPALSGRGPLAAFCASFLDELLADAVEVAAGDAP